MLRLAAVMQLASRQQHSCLAAFGWLLAFQPPFDSGSEPFHFEPGLQQRGRPALRSREPSTGGHSVCRIAGLILRVYSFVRAVASHIDITLGDPAV
jgi:hypothetical protein